MTDAPFRPRLVRCPACGGESIYAPSNPNRPFCSARCKNRDFGAWASETYGIEAKARDDEEGDPDAER